MSKVFKHTGEHTTESEGIPKHTYVGIALDSSGSMGYLIDSTISGFNEYLETIKAESKKGGRTKVSLLTFGGTVENNFTNVAPSKIRPLTRGAYKPSGTTPMYDGIGQTLDLLEEYDIPQAKKNAFLVIIISDGQENASVKWNRSQIAMRISRLKETGRWTFAYVGANQDLFEVSQWLTTTPLTWSYTDIGTRDMYSTLSHSTSCYFMQRDEGESSVDEFFEPVKETTSGEITNT